MTETEWRETTVMPLLHLESELGWPSPRKQRLLAVACARRAALLLPDPASLASLAVAERYADRKAKRTEVIESRPPGRGVSRRKAKNADLLRQHIEAAIHFACEPWLRLYAGNAAIHSASAAAYATLPLDEAFVPPAQSKHHALWRAGEAAEIAAQKAMVFEICGNPFLPPKPGLGRSPREIARLAQAAYEERTEAGQLDNARLGVLSDALEEAGCDDEAILLHLRSPGPHVRGCWALDLVLGKE